MKGYGQYCPVAHAVEILAERWTPLVLRELLSGSHRFNDIRRGVPHMSPTLLSQRLQSLRRAGIVERRRDGESGMFGYHLTRAGCEIRPIIEGLGVWGKRWARREIDRRDLDAGLLMWDVQHNIELECLPPRRVVIFFDLEGAAVKKRYWWLVCDRDTAQLCLTDPGFETDVSVHCDLMTLTRVWMGDVEMRDAMRSGRLRVSGPPELTRRFPSWLRLSRFAGIPRQL